MHTAAAAQLAIGHRRSNSLPSGGCPSRRCGSPGQWTGTWKQRGSVERGGFKDLFAAFSLGCTNSPLIVHFISLAISCNRNNTDKYR